MNYRVLYLSIGTFAISTVGFAFAGLLPSIASDIHIPMSQAGYVIAAYSLAYAIGAPILSAAAGASDRRYLLCAAMGVFFLGNLWAAASSGLLMLAAAQVVMGMAAGLFVATAQATAIAMVAPQQSGRAVSLVFVGTTLAVALGAPLGSLIAGEWGWRNTYLSIAAIAFVCMGVIWLQIPRGLRGSRLGLRERLLAIRKPGIGYSLLVSLLYVAGGFAVISYMAPLAMDGAGLPERMLPVILLAFGVGAVVGNLGSGYLSDRIGPTRVVAFSLAMSTLFALAISLGAKYLPPAAAGPALIAFMIPWGILGWTFPPAQSIRMASLAPEATHLTLSLNVSALYFGVALGTMIGGRVLEHASASDLGYVAAIFPVLALFALQRGTRRRPSPAGDAS